MMPARRRAQTLGGKRVRSVIVELSASQAADVDRIRRALARVRGRPQSVDDVVALALSSMLCEVKSWHEGA